MSIWAWVVCFLAGWIVISFPLAVWLGKMIDKNQP